MIWHRRRGVGKKEDVLPSGYTRLDYVENTSNSYLRPGVYISNDDIIEIEFTPSAYSGLKFICGGANVSSGVKNFFLATTLQQWQYRPSSSYTFSAGTKYKVRFGSGLFEVNGQSKNIDKGSINSVSLALFTDNTLDSRRFLGKIHSVKIEGKINYIPCKDETNNVGFYNTYDKNLYLSQANPFVGG